MPFLASLEGLFGYGRFVIANQFLPSDIFGLAFWLDATRITGLASNTGMTNWSDVGPYGFVGTGSGSPVYLTNVINSKPIVRFNGTSQYFTFGNILNMETNPIYMFAMYRYNSAASQNALFGKTSFRGNPGRWALTRDANSNQALIQTDSVTAASVNYPDTTTNTQMSEGLWNRSVVLLRKNGTLCNSATLSSAASHSNSDPLAVGAYPNSTGTFPPQYYMNGDIAELLMYNRFMTAYQIQQVEGYLAWKWGIQTSLPSGHPFRSVAPTSSTASFQPTMLNNLQGWFDASDPLATGTAPATGTSISTWSDKSGFGRNATGGTAGNYSNTNGGMIYFNGTSTNYPITSIATTIVNQYFTVFIVERLQAGGNYAFMGGTSSTNNTNLFLTYLNGTGTSTTMRYSFYGNDLDATTIPAFTTAGAQPMRIWSFSQRLINRSTYLNGSNFASDANNNLLSSWAGAIIGYYTAGGQRYLGNMHEILFYTGIVPYYQQQQIEGYLAWKWGLQSNLQNWHPFYSSAPTNASVSFLPSMLSNNTLWLDAADSNTFTLSGSSVATWFDKSGTGYNAVQTIVGSRPTRVTYGSSYAVDFDGVDDYLSTGKAISAFFQNSTRSIFVVGLARTVATNDTTNAYQNDAFLGDTGGNVSIYMRSAGPTVGSFNWAGSNTIATTTLTLNSLTLFNYTLSASLVGIRLNGGTQVTAASGSTTVTSNTLDIGRQFNNNAYNLDGQIMEVLIYSQDLGLFQRQQTEGYLAWKWGFQSNLYLGHPFRLAAPITAPIPFVPSMLQDITLWLDAADSNAFTLSGSSVDTWIDKSGRENNATQATAGSKPSRVAYGLLNAVDFDGTDDFLETGKAISVFFQNNSRSIFVVGLARTVSTNNTSNAYQNDAFLGDRGGLVSIYMRSVGPIVGAYNWASSNTIVTTTFTLNSLTLFNYTLSASLVGIRLNGGTQTTAASGSTSDLTFALDIGRQFNNNAYNLNGQIMEVLIYSQDLTVAQRQLVEGYLAWKWGLQSNLPAGHPYKNLRPTNANLP